MHVDSYEHGVPSWVDLATPDPTAAGQFYAGLFGWEVEPGPPEAGGYAMCHLHGRTWPASAPSRTPVRRCGRPTST